MPTVIADSGAELQGRETATTVKTGENGAAVVVDGPFSEAKESIGGFSVIDVPDLDAAIAMVKEWPALGLPGRRDRDPADGGGLQPVRGDLGARGSLEGLSRGHGAGEEPPRRTRSSPGSSAVRPA